jgi:L-rhamnose-H+ transport protein
MINLGFVFGAPVLERANRLGIDPLWAANAIWLPLMMAGALPNLAYCAHLMRRNRTGTQFVAARTRANWLYAAVMAAFWFGSITLYGLASQKLGSWGLILGWPLFTSLIVVTAGGLGIAFGEWNAARPHGLRLQICGMAVLVLAVFVLSAASQLG